MAKKVIVLSVIGDTTNYREALYSLDKQSIEVKSRYSAAALCKMIDADKLVIFVPVSTVVGDIDNTITNDYSVLESKVSSRTASFIEDQLPDSIAFDIVVIPLMGTFISTKEPEKSITLDVLPSSVGFYFYRKIVEELESCFENDRREVELCLDITHSVNYASVLMVEMAKIAAQAASVKLNLNLTITVYNSDPFVKATLPKLIIHDIEKRQESHDLGSLNRLCSDFYYSIDKGKLINNLANLGISEPQRNLPRIASYFAIVGALLAISYFFEEVNQLRKTLWEEIVLFTKSTNFVVTKQGDKFLVKALKRGLLLIVRSHAILYALSNSVFGMGEAVRVEKLKLLAEKLLSEPASGIVKNEINLIEKSFVTIDIEETAWRHIGSTNDSSGACECKGLNRRNFIAHAGLENNVTFVRRKDSVVQISYLDCFKEITKEFKSI